MLWSGSAALSETSCRQPLLKEQTRDIDVLAIGRIDADLVLRVPHIPGHDEKVRADFEGWQSGGPVGNMACAASRLGLNVHAVCQVGTTRAVRGSWTTTARTGSTRRCAM